MIEKYRFPIINISQFYPRPGTVAAKWKRVPTKEVKARSTEVATLFNSYNCYDWLQGQTVRVWILEKEPKKPGQMVGHTKEYVKVVLEEEEGLLGKQALVKITETSKWHVVGKIVKYDPKPEPVPENYWQEAKRK